MMAGLDRESLRDAHAHYLGRLVTAALADGVVTEVERSDLLRVSTLLGCSSEELDAMIEEQRLNPAMSPDSGTTEVGAVTGGLAGCNVCFTGECQCSYEGQLIDRSLAEELAARAGLVPVPSVTKKLDVLVVSDPFTQSGKAKKARKYGIRVLHEPVFWQTIGIELE